MSAPDMPTIEKLFKAVSLIHAAYRPATPSTHPDPQPQPQPHPDTQSHMMDFQLSSADYASLVRLLGSAILDLAPGPAPAAQKPLPAPSAQPEPETTHPPPDFPADVLGLSRLFGPTALSLPVRTIPTASTTPEPAMPALEPAHLSFSTLARALPALVPTINEPKTEKQPQAGGEAKALTEPNKFLNLPTEIISRIFREARTMSEDPKAWAPSASKRLPISTTAYPTEGPASQAEEADAANEEHLEDEDEEIAWPPVEMGQGQFLVQWAATTNGMPSLGLGIPGSMNQGIKTIGGPSHAQVYGHSLSRIVKALTAVGRRTAWEKVFVSNRKQIGNLMGIWSGSTKKTLSTGEHSKLSGKEKERTGPGSVGLVDGGLYVLELEIHVPVSLPDDQHSKDIHNRRTHGHHRTNLNTNTNLQSSISSTQQSRKSALENDKLPKFLNMMPNLKILSLSLSDNGHSKRSVGGFNGGGLSGLGYGLDGLEGMLLQSICLLKSLTNLTLQQGIDFSEIEVLLPCLPDLKELRLLGGIQNTDGQTNLDSDTVIQHQSSLEIFVLHLPCSNSGISSAQLEWVLSPSIGTLKEMDIAFWTRPVGSVMWGGIMVDGPENSQARWATKTFADLLLKLGPTLKNLTLRGNPVAGAIDPSLHAEPHNGSLDYALSFCSKLRHLAIDWCVTGPELLKALTVPPGPEEQLLMNQTESDQQQQPTPPTNTTTSTITTTVDPASSSSSSNSDVQGPIGPPNGQDLKTLSLLGRPRHVSALMFRELLEDGQEVIDNGMLLLPKLEAITLTDFPTRQVHLIPWPSKELRKLQNVCRKRNIWFGITS